MVVVRVVVVVVVMGVIVGVIESSMIGECEEAGDAGGKGETSTSEVGIEGGRFRGGRGGGTANGVAEDIGGERELMSGGGGRI